MQNFLTVPAMIVICFVSCFAQQPAFCEQINDLPPTSIGSAPASSGQLTITADKTKGKLKELFEASGHVVVSISGQDSRLEADHVFYERDYGLLEALGHVRIVRHGELSQGSSFKFHIDSPEYLVTETACQIRDMNGLPIPAAKPHKSLAARHRRKSANTYEIFLNLTPEQELQYFLNGKIRSIELDLPAYEGIPPGQRNKLG